ncbi:hypothetical protein [Foetidibacter luteolus]|uniref:hypothetical protein n=1 Tax=Foetidibacter luteolus TaxID=2608880 RepID=UPI00129B6308|nr:hypothetical protein [Foetidibacter luteolus]
MSKSKETFLKREKEKKRLQKRTEKESRKQERKAHSLSGKPLSEMLVYVDENGNFSDTPPQAARPSHPSPGNYRTESHSNSRINSFNKNRQAR